MEGVGAWAIMVAADRFEAERLYQRDGIVLAGLAAGGVVLGDHVMLVAAGQPPVVFALGSVSATHRETLSDGDDLDGVAPVDGDIAISYMVRFFDDPRPVSATVALVSVGDVVPIDESQWSAYAGQTPAAVASATAAESAPARQTWLVSLDLPIEASSAAEAVRQFWTYVAELGPRELPTFVSPAGDELAMQAMVAGVEVNLDPEEDG